MSIIVLYMIVSCIVFMLQSIKNVWIINNYLFLCTFIISYYFYFYKKNKNLWFTTRFDSSPKTICDIISIFRTMLGRTVLSYLQMKRTTPLYFINTKDSIFHNLSHSGNSTKRLPKSHKSKIVGVKYYTHILIHLYLSFL